MAVLEFSGIAYGYSDERVIVEATAALHAGNIVGLIGANGGGKTTLLRVLLGELKPEEGQVQHAKSMKLADLDLAPSLSIDAEVPLASMFGYSTDLRSATEGKAEFTMEFAKYAPAPTEVSEELLKKYKSQVVEEDES